MIHIVKVNSILIVFINKFGLIRQIVIMYVLKSYIYIIMNETHHCIILNNLIFLLKEGTNIINYNFRIVSNALEIGRVSFHDYK